jgi:hypothetical protein
VKRFGSLLIPHKYHLTDAGPESAPRHVVEQQENCESAPASEVIP